MNIFYIKEVKVITILGISKAGRNRVRKYGLRKILKAQKGQKTNI